MTRYSYDNNLNLTQVVGPDDATYVYTYDVNGNLTSETNPLGYKTTFTYNLNNDMTSYTDAMGNSTNYDYNSQNNLLSVAFANGTQQSSTYDPLGQATSFIDADGDAIGYAYDADGLVTKETFADGTSYSFTYNVQGNMTSARDADGNVTTFIYSDSDNAELLTEVEYSDGTWLKFTYNIVGQRTQSEDQSEFTVNYIYDALGRLSELTDGDGDLIVLYTYDAAGNLIQKDNGNRTFTIYTYDGDENILSITNYAPSTGSTSYDPADSTINSFDDYKYDALGNVLADTSQNGEWVYTYDADSQLVQAIFTPNSTDPNGLTAQNLQYTYDADGNRISGTANGVTTTYVTNDVNEYTSSTTNGVTTAYSYDANGNLIAQIVGGSTTSYTYNELNELTAVNGPGLTANYGYNPLGEQISQTVNDATTSYELDPSDLGNVVATFGDDGTLTADYVYGLGLVSQVSSADLAGYYDANNVGSVVGITGPSGGYVNTYDYLPFGQATNVLTTLTNPFTFVGEFGVIQEGPSLYYMNARDYTPTMGQFLSADPIGLAGGDNNLRRYAGNDPINGADPSGLAWFGSGPLHWGNGIPNIYIPNPMGLGQGILFGGEGLNHEQVFFSSPQWINSLGRYVTNVGFGSDGHLFPFEDGDPYIGKYVQNVPGYYDDATLAAKINQWYGQGQPYFLAVNDCQVAAKTWLAMYQSDPNAPPPTPGPCTIAIGGLFFYICLNDRVYGVFIAPINIPGVPCGPLDVAKAFVDFEPGPVGGELPPPSIDSVSNCNPQYYTLLLIDQHGISVMSDPPVDTTPPVTGTDEAASGVGSNGSISPLSFFAAALGNLGLISGPGGNDDEPDADAAQMVSTMSTFDEGEAVLEDLLDTASSEGGSIGIPGDIALIQRVEAALETVTTAENLLFGGDANWLDTTQSATLQQWMTDFLTDAESSTDGGQISAAETTQLLATTLPSSVSTSEAQEFIDRWNRTVQYWSEGIFTAAQVPSGQSTDFLDIGAIQAAFSAAVTAEQEAEVNGYGDVGAETQGALAQFQSDLAGQGTCATIKLQIDQSATLTQTAFSGTLTITNTEGTGAMSNVTMDINITDAEGNPANGEFFVTSPSYSGAFDVVDGVATLPDYSSGTISFTFIPANTAAANGPTEYNIGGTIGFTDPSGGAVTIPVFPSTITVDPQAELQLNYFLQKDVVDPSEPATLGLLVTNVGAGTANSLTITTAQPQILQNAKGLLDTFQIVGTQVGNQQETPSLSVDFGDIAPGQTADATFLLQSMLPGVFDNFTATYSNSDALGGSETSLIESVTTHTLVYAGDFNYPDSTGATDYLVDR